MSVLPLSTGYSGARGSLKRRMVNMFMEKTPRGSSKVINRPRPGLDLALTLDDGPIRLNFLWDGHRIVISGTQAFWDGLPVGVIPGDDKCRFAVSEEQVVIGANSTAFIISGAGVAPITDPDLPMFVVDVGFLAGRFLYLDGNSSQFFWSAVGDATNIDGLAFATADENSAEVLRACFVFNDDVVFLTNAGTEWWAPQDDIDNPFQRSPGRKYTKGIAARNTTVLLDNTMWWLGSDKFVYRASSVPQRQSTFDIEDLLEQLSDVELAGCYAFGYTVGGHAFYVLTLPGLGTWAFDVATGEWAQWSSWGKDRFRGVTYDGQFLGDNYSGNLYQFNLNTFNDDVDPMERVVSAYMPVEAGSVRNPNIHLKTVKGVGLLAGPGVAPVVELRYSDNDGSNFSVWLWATLGAFGDKSDAAKAIWRMLGSIRAPGRLYEWRCTDPVYFAPYEARVNEKLS